MQDSALLCRAGEEYKSNEGEWEELGGLGCFLFSFGL